MAIIDYDQHIGSYRPIDAAPRVNVDGILVELKNIPNIQAPENKKQTKALALALQNATATSPLTLYAGSCPDYSHANGLYTHESVGEGVPLLSKVHLDIDINLLKALDQARIPYEYVLMVADVEAIDEVFCDKFTQGSPEEFVRRCQASSRATQGILDEATQVHQLSGILRSSSFFAEFGYENFMDLQQRYSRILAADYEADGSVHARVNSDIIARMPMYNKMYDTILPNLGLRESHDFLVSRDIRTKAQYLTLGRAISQARENAVIINHPTTNIGLFNDRNKYPLAPGDTQQRTVPVFEMRKKVY